MLLLALGGSVAGAKEKKDDMAERIEIAYYALIDSASACIDRGEWAAAEQFTQKAINLKPDDETSAMLLCNLATIQRYERRYDEALANYNRALKISPNSAQMLHNRARLYTEAGMIDEAKGDYDSILARDSLDIEALYNRGMLRVNTDDFDAARADFDRINAIEPGSKYATEGMAMINKANGNYQEAIDLYSLLISKQPTAILLSQRADCYMRIEQYNEASADINDAISLDPDDPYLYLVRGKLGHLRFSREDVHRDYDMAVKLGIDPETAKKAITE